MLRGESAEKGRAKDDYSGLNAFVSLSLSCSACPSMNVLVKAVELPLLLDRGSRSRRQLSAAPVAPSADSSLLLSWRHEALYSCAAPYTFVYAWLRLALLRPSWKAAARQ
jgi:hypothetical protein